MKINDALRVINKCRRMYTDLDFTNIVIVTEDDFSYRFGEETAGVCVGGSDVYIGLPKDKEYNIGWLEFPKFMNTVLHEVLHRHDPEFGHGESFQRLCLKYGLDPIRETTHDKRVTERLYPMNETDYKKYRFDNGTQMDPCAETDAGWALYEKHHKTYDRKCHAYKRHTGSVLDLVRLRA